MAAVGAALLLAAVIGVVSVLTDGGGGDGGGGESAEAPSSPVAGQLVGAGSTWQTTAQDLWMAEFTATNPGATISYDPTGSGAGRYSFITGEVDFAGIDLYLTEQELADAGAWCDDVIQIPTHLTPVHLVFRLDGHSRLSLSPGTLAGIFDGRITSWDDRAIALDNPGVDLPGVPIVPVPRSDPSFVTEHFTAYLAATAPADWPYPASGDWPTSTGEFAELSLGVIQTVEAVNGTIGYVPAPWAEWSDALGTVALGAGTAAVDPLPEAATRQFQLAERVQGRGASDFAYEPAWQSPAPDAYPLVIASYTVACATPDDPAQADLLRAYLSYLISEEGQEAAADQTSSAPLPGSLREPLQQAVNAIG